MIPTKEVCANILSILGVTTPFVQGGSIRMTLPKRMVKKYDIERKKSKEYYGFIFVDTDKGVLLVPLDKAVNPDNIKNALSFIDLSRLTKEDIEILFEEEE